MSRKIDFLFWTILLLFGMACHPGKKLRQGAATTLQARVQQYIDCLNNPSIQCLQNMYSTDFEGLAPLVKHKSKDSLIAQIHSNYTQNNWQIEGKMIELEAGADLGYVLLDWKILQASDMDTVREIFNKRHLQIWVYKPKEGWQLKRSLFYDPTAILF